jgi:hypothetical protein
MLFGLTTADFSPSAVYPLGFYLSLDSAPAFTYTCEVQYQLQGSPQQQDYSGELKKIGVKAKPPEIAAVQLQNQPSLREEIGTTKKRMVGGKCIRRLIAT